MFEKYIMVDNDKYKATVKQSMSSGMWFVGELQVKAGSRKELCNELEACIKSLTSLLNKFNKQASNSTPSKNTNVKGLK